MTWVVAIVLFGAVFAFGFITCWYVLIAFLREHGVEPDRAFEEYMRRKGRLL